MDGIFPSIDQFGNPMLGKRALKAGQSICGGWRGAFDSWTGDWKERALSHCFIRRNYQSTQVCDQCLAVKPFARTPQNLLRLVFTDFSETAPWRSTLQSHDEYVQNTPVDQRTNLVRCTWICDLACEMGFSAYNPIGYWERFGSKRPVRL